MKIYIDSDFKCHVSNSDGTLRGVDVPFFDRKCKTLVEGYRYLPPGESWTREDGKVFNMEMIVPWKNLLELTAAQNQYEADLAESAVAYQEGVNSAYDQ